MAPSHNVQGIVPGPLVQPTQTPGDPLEQRILDLLYPYRDECFDPEADVSAEQERMALVLCENIAFLVRHNQSSYGKHIDPNDVSMCSRNWNGMKKGNGPAGIGVFVNGGNGYTHTVCRVQVLKGQNAVEQFASVIDGFMATFFPNPPS
ncbi:hypothetical protein FB567DRAFT_446470 [Paraphoma chrysanthemicola]|uniref:Uncharacterized protein n=1 Tax=Paraphoma chrysanthemicola TaxID=798071 RepID=A0A8K0VX85_9PLEO|nr:hypothetical protein FB567DRAFT_446470 [Paraphoma chrysanthemicola]